MSGKRYCPDCATRHDGPTAICAPCKIENRRLAALHAFFAKYLRRPADRLTVGERVAEYARRAEAGLPLFEEAP